MNKPLPFLNPVTTILPLTTEDQCLDKRPDTVSLPPISLGEACWLAHYVIRQSIYAGTHILHHLLTNPPGTGFHLVPLMLYRHVLDIGDSIGTLLRFGSANSAAVLVRALFESSVGLEFVLQNNKFHEDRASCYETFRRIKRLKNLIRYDPGTKEGAELHAILDSDTKLKDAKFSRQDLSKEREAVESMLNEKRFRPHWEKYKQAKPRPKDWYGLCSTATNLRSLAKEIEREAEYLLLYKMLSEVAHASDVMSGVVITHETKKVSIAQLRGPVEKVKELLSLAANYLVWSHNHLLLTYLKGHEVHQRFGRWYIEDYRDFFDWAVHPGPLFLEQQPPSA